MQYLEQIDYHRIESHTRREDVRYDPSYLFDTCKCTHMNTLHENIFLQRDAEAIRTALYLGVALAITWIIGAAGLSLAWLVLVLALTTTVVKARVSRLLQTELQHELARLRRRRALYKDETAEWLSLLLNKWQVLFLAVIDKANHGKKENTCATWLLSDCYINKRRMHVVVILINGDFQENYFLCLLIAAFYRDLLQRRKS